MPVTPRERAIVMDAIPKEMIMLFKGHLHCVEDRAVDILDIALFLNLLRAKFVNLRRVLCEILFPSQNMSPWCRECTLQQERRI